MLIYEDANIPFEPGLYFFSGPFGIYDLDEMENYLNQYDPNDAEDHKHLAKHAIDSLSWVSVMSYRHTWLAVHVLEETLNDQHHNFSQYFEDDVDEYFYLPGDWEEVKNPRDFFVEILTLAKEEWKDDLEKVAQEDPTTW